MPRASDAAELAALRRTRCPTSPAPSSPSTPRSLRRPLGGPAALAPRWQARLRSRRPARPRRISYRDRRRALAAGHRQPYLLHGHRPWRCDGEADAPYEALPAISGAAGRTPLSADRRHLLGLLQQPVRAAAQPLLHDDRLPAAQRGRQPRHAHAGDLDQQRHRSRRLARHATRPRSAGAGQATGTPGWASPPPAAAVPFPDQQRGRRERDGPPGSTRAGRSGRQLTRRPTPCRPAGRRAP